MKEERRSNSIKKQEERAESERVVFNECQELNSFIKILSV